MGKYDFLNRIDRDPSNLIKGLQLVQTTEGFVSDEALRAVAAYFDKPVVEVEGVISFYAQFKRKKPGKYRISVCDGTACHIKGSEKVLDWVTSELNLKDGETTSDGLFSLETVACLGCCSLAPVMSINGEIFAKLDRRKTMKILQEHRNK
ncbi:MAG: NAD(P)H-dependent oxidoreductase subunit E [Lentisphaeria bacterium]|nr:NAD(P)H-dependent oxidoreductase subunit E [Lentisphaeria bacterium]